MSINLKTEMVIYHIFILLFLVILSTTFAVHLFFGKETKELKDGFKVEKVRRISSTIDKARYKLSKTIDNTTFYLYIEGNYSPFYKRGDSVKILNRKELP